MKHLFFKGLILLCVITLNISTSNAQCVPDGEGGLVSPDGRPCVNTIVTAVPFLRITPDARGGAMGDVGLATSVDPNAMHYNISKIAFTKKDFGISATYTPWLRALGVNDVYLAYLSGYKSIDPNQAIGFSVRFFSLGNIQYTNDQGESTGTGRPNEFELMTGYSRKLGDYVAVGLGLKFVYSSIATDQTVDGENVRPGTTFGGDLSFTFRKPIKIGDRKATISTGLAITNIAPKISYTNSVNKDFVPTNIGLGTAIEYNIDDYNSITFAFDINKLMVPTSDGGVDEDNNDIPDYKEVSLIQGMFSSFADAPNGAVEELRELMYSTGIEYWYDKQFAVRAGYYSEHSTKGNRKFATVGLGLKYSIFGLNFSYLVPLSSNRNPLDNTLRFSLLFELGENSKKGKKKNNL